MAIYNNVKGNDPYPLLFCTIMPAIRSSTSASAASNTTIHAENRATLAIGPTELPGQVASLSSPTFRWGGKKYLLTYSQVSFFFFFFFWYYFLIFFNQIGNRSLHFVAEKMAIVKATTWHTVAKTHADGGVHWHVLAFWNKGYRGCGPNALDIDGLHSNVRMYMV